MRGRGPVRRMSLMLRCRWSEVVNGMAWKNTKEGNFYYEGREAIAVQTVGLNIIRLWVTR